MSDFARIRFLALALFLLSPLGSSSTQLDLIQGEPAAVEEAHALDLEQLARERAEITTQLDQQQESGETDNAEEIALLNRLSLVLDRILKLAPTLPEIQEERERIGAELAKIRASGLTLDKPFTFRELDALRDEYKLELDRVESTATSIKTARTAVEDASSALASRERQQRLAADTLQNASDAGDEAIARGEHALAVLQQRVAAMMLELRQLELEEIEARRLRNESRVDLLRAKIDDARDRTLLTQAELESVLTELARETARLEAELSKTRGTLPYVESRWKSASDRLAEQTAATEQDRQEVSTLYQSKETSRYLERALSERLSRLAERRQRWEQRLSVSRDELDSEERVTLAADLERRRTELRLEKTKAHEHLDPMRSELRALDLRIEQDNGIEEISQQLSNQRRYLSQRIATYELNIASMEVLDSLIERLYVDLCGEEDDPLSGTWRRFTVAAETIWSYEISTLNETPITVRKIVLGLVILLLGLRLSRVFSQFLGNRLLPGIGLDKPAAAVVRTLLFYVLTLTFILFALNFVDVPLTAFTVLGGALAVGVGFGSQNIVNNFISGLILLVEQPVRVGDLIQIGDLYGNVVRIGARSTQVRTGSNVEIMVPNSSFLENNVVNLTLSDDRIRAHVEVGVAYGSPVREVTKLLKRSASEHGRVLKNPDPFVLFESFGDNSLMFEVHFWIQARAVMDRRLIESDIRARIDSVFRGAGIEIAFPQRDIHLNTRGPLQVQVVEPEPVETEAASG